MLSFAKRTIYHPIRNNQTLCYSIVGASLICANEYIVNLLNFIPFLPDNLDKVTISLGTAILGGGVFSALIKSSQFSKIFEERIFEIFYNPEKTNDKEALHSKWRTITTAILKDLLPASYIKATDKIQNQFFKCKEQYHFENHTITYSIKIDETNDTCEITNTSKSTVVISPNSVEPVFEQKYSVDSMKGSCTLFSVLINGEIQDVKFTNDANGGQSLKIPLKKYMDEDKDVEHKVEIERTIIMKQRLTDEPYIEGNISRYVKGCIVKAKIDKNYRLIFSKFGIGDMRPEDTLVNDGQGYQRWTLAARDKLLLPGQGYIMIMVPPKKGVINAQS